MASTSSETFDQLLVHCVEQQMQSAGQGTLHDQYLLGTDRASLLSRLKAVRESAEKTSPLFDKTSLSSMAYLFDRADAFHDQFCGEHHPAQWLFKNHKEWFPQSYRFMYNQVSFLELIRFFAVGRNEHDKEIVFRAVVAKLIKTQDTVRKISLKKDLIAQYLQEHPDFKKRYPEHLQKLLNLSEALSPEESIVQGMKLIIQDISAACLKLFIEIHIKLHERAKGAFEKKEYYDALVLNMRHTKGELFEDLGSDDYPILVKHLGFVIERSLLHPEIYMYQSIKRYYMTDWLVHSLREYDEQDTKTFYQAGKAAIYAKFAPLEISKSSIAALKERSQLKVPTTINAELTALRDLSEHDFYELLLKIYSRYKDDHRLGQNLPSSAQVLATGGDIHWEKQNMMVQAAKKVNAAKSSETEEGKRRGKRFQGLFDSLKKVTDSFSQVTKKMEDKPDTAQSEQEPIDPNLPPLKIVHHGNLLETCFPVPSSEVAKPAVGQRQDLAFKDNDNDAVIALAEQEFLVHLFHVSGDESLNKAYNKYANAVMAILRCYGSEVRHIQKKISLGGSVLSFTEEVVYVRVRNDLIAAIGITNMGKSKLVSMPNGLTAYIRLFVKGELQQKLLTVEAPMLVKDFPEMEKSVRYREVLLPHFEAEIQYQAMAIECLVKILEGLSKEQFDFLNESTLIGFVDLMQEKAKRLVENGITFSEDVRAR